MEDSLQNAAELKRQADELKHLATEMERSVVAYVLDGEGF
jgi:hypothetical protein